MPKLKKEHCIYLYTDSASPRLLYANYLVFDLLSGLKPVICEDLESFKAMEGPKINYSRLNIENSFHIIPASLLFESGIKNASPEYTYDFDIPFLFPTQKGDLNFDPLAAAFYVASRYEEYTPFKKDTHDRFPAEASIQHKLHCLHLPIVQIWVKYLQIALAKKFSTLEFKELQHSYQPTFDIDMAWSYKEKGAYRVAGAWLRDLAQFNIYALKERWQVLSNQIKDPFDTYSYFIEQTKGLEPCYFFLMGKNSKYDKNINPTNSSFIQLLQNTATHSTVGIHPSYYSAQHLNSEVKALQQATGKTIKHSRQHFIRLEFPSTYKRLIDNNIEHDYSMGYPDKVGFRNGLAVPSYWYDLIAEEQTQLSIHPFQIMDVTLKNYLALNPEEAIAESKKIADTIKKYGGNMISIWHNSSFDKQWTGWKKVFEEILSYSSNQLNKPRL